MDLDRINHFPIGCCASDYFDAVYIGDVVPNYIYYPLAKALKAEYIFLFTTYLDPQSEGIGYIEINLVKEKEISAFHRAMYDYGKFHIMTKKEPLIINEFLEIIFESNQNGWKVYAILNKQNILDRRHNVTCIKDLYIVLAEGGERFNNKPPISLGPEFQAQYEYDLCKAKHKHKYSILSTLKNHAKHVSPEYIEEMEKEVEKLKIIEDNAFHRFLEISSKIPH